MPQQGRLGDKSSVPDDAHGCPACPHPCVGPAVSGSTNVFVNGKPALRVGDTGIHAACCGPNTWQAKTGAPYVLFNDKKAHRHGDSDEHCGGMGRLIEGSPNVFVGNLGGQTAEPDDVRSFEIWWVIQSTLTRTPFANVAFRVLDSDDRVVMEGRTGEDGKIRRKVPAGIYRLELQQGGGTGDLWLQLLGGDYLSPLINTPYELKLSSTTLSGTTDGDGKLKHQGVAMGNWTVRALEASTMVATRKAPTSAGRVALQGVKAR